MSTADKAESRQRLQAWRRTLTPADVRRFSRTLGDRLLGSPLLRRCGWILAYDALAREPQTADLTRALRAAGVALALPLVVGRGLQARRAASPGSHWELAALAPLDALALDAVLVPGLGFDRTGGRLGRGGGHYDRFLAEVRPDCVRIGLCFQGQLTARLPVDPWDQTVDWVVTECGLWRGRRRVGAGG